MDKCNLCPRKCNINRKENIGFCLCKDKTVVSKYMLHRWEEPSVSGTMGSGAVFFSGCTLKCVYCQNQKISRYPTGQELDERQLADIFLKLQDEGAHNINLITPTHFANNIIKALDIAKPKLSIPIVYNTSGYETVESLKMLSGYIDVYLPDFKYYDKDISQKYSKAPDYFDIAIEGIKEMYEQVGEYKENEKGLVEKGLIIRHLVLPKCRFDSEKILKEIKKVLPIENIRLSLMSQFTPDFVPEDYKELSRKITSFEYNYVLDKAIEMGYLGFFQQRDSATAIYTPDF